MSGAVAASASRSSFSATRASASSSSKRAANAWSAASVCSASGLTGLRLGTTMHSYVTLEPVAGLGPTASLADGAGALSEAVLPVGVQRRVLPIRGEQPGGRAVLEDTATAEHQDPVRDLHRGQPVRDDHRSPHGQDGPQRGLDQLLTGDGEE